MHRFFCDIHNISSQEIILEDKNQLHHMRDVLRLKHNNTVNLLDGRGASYICQIINIDKRQAKLKIISKSIYNRGNLRHHLTIACAVPKNSKIDFIVEKLTELGIHKIILLFTERTEIKPKDLSKKIQKLKRISIEALKQSNSKFLPEIEFMNFKELLKTAKDSDLSILPNLGEESVSIRTALAGISEGNVLAAIGPEGDFSDREIELAKHSGFISVSLGDTILKVDTAAIVVAGLVKLYFTSKESSK